METENKQIYGIFNKKATAIESPTYDDIIKANEALELRIIDRFNDVMMAHEQEYSMIANSLRLRSELESERKKREELPAAKKPVKKPPAKKPPAKKPPAKRPTRQTKQQEADESESDMETDSSVMPALSDSSDSSENHTRVINFFKCNEYDEMGIKELKDLLEQKRIEMDNRYDVLQSAKANFAIVTFTLV